MANCKLKEHINIADGFQYSVNIEYDIQNEDKVKGFIPTTSSYEIIEDVILSTHPASSDRARILIGAYGKGKSHMILVLVSLLMNKNRSVFFSLLAKIKDYSEELYNYINDYINSKKRLLPVIIQSGSTTLTQSFLVAMQRTLDAEGLSDLMPDTHFKTAVSVIENWSREYKDTYENFQSFLKQPINEFILRLEQFDAGAYEEFELCYPKLTSGSIFNPFLGLNVIDLYADVTKKLKNKGYDGIYVIYDEFSKFLEADITKVQSIDVRLLQDFAEKCNRSHENQMHILLIAHKDISNYIDKLPKQKVDGWRGVSERFKHIQIKNNFSQVYDIISTVINQDRDYFKAFFKTNKEKFDEMEIIYKNSRAFDDLESEMLDTVVYSCYPMHPISTFILPRLSEKVAQNERTLFTFLSSQNKNTLWDYVNHINNPFPMLTPDYIYDYFEPLFKREAYTSDTYEIWKLTANILNSIDDNSLGAKIIKVIALIYITDQFEKLAPTSDTISSIFCETFSAGEIAAAISDLKQNQYVIYQYKSNNYLRLKKNIGIDIKEMIDVICEKNKGKFIVKDIINEFNAESFLYPTRYNDNNEITRYFELRFIEQDEFLKVDNWACKIDDVEGNGAVYAVMVYSSEEREVVLSRIRNMPSTCDRVMFIISQENALVEKDAFEYKAVNLLKQASNDDEMLLQELEIYIEDNEKVLKAYISTFLLPEMRKAEYYYNGEKQQIFRKAQISELLSNICSNTYYLTPIIKNELVNKDFLGSGLINFRNKVINALLSSQLVENLGLSGFGPDVSIMRSILINTGILTNIETLPKIVMDGNRENLYQNVLGEIEDFFKNANGTEFQKLYDVLIKPEYHIGLKKGVIPVLIAVVLHSMKKYVVICKSGNEIEIGAELLNAINESPEQYTAYLENWDTKKADYIIRLEIIFKDSVQIREKEYNTFAYIVKAMQRWFISLPRYSKDMISIYQGNGENKKLTNDMVRFANYIKRSDINAREFLFDKIPKIFNSDKVSLKICDSIELTKCTFDEAKEQLLKGLTVDIRGLFFNGQSEQATLASIIKDWYDSLKESTKNYLFDKGEDKILSLMQTITNDEMLFVERLAKSVVGLRVDDWNADNIINFNTILELFKQTVEKQNSNVEFTGKSNVSNSYKITFLNEAGVEETKTFSKTEYSNRARLLYNEIEQSIDEMGQAISENEKRQVLMDVIEKLCR